MALRVETLPPHLGERTRPLAELPVPAAAEFVLYWMRTACRGHENPALDVAVWAATQLGLPVLAYHQLIEEDAYASDRQHTFVLEGARDVAVELRDRSIPYLLNVQRPGRRAPHLLSLAARSALVVTEEMPVRPFRSQVQSLAALLEMPIWAVDTACVVPMGLVGRPYERAFAFRDATAVLRRECLGRPWTDVIPGIHGPLPSDLPFVPVDPGAMDIPSLVAACDIDHGVAPVAHTRGGSAAGYARWRDFRDHRLSHYATRRNDALDRDGVSRLSAYLHWGQVSPFRIAREAHAQGGGGAAKFLDELLTWRELSYSWCFWRADHDQWSALPRWARDTLTRHADDRRPLLASWEMLARARTGDALWDTAQRSLLIHGELHNNVRMTWGKAILNWTPDAPACLRTIVDLNHRYALDGQDPNSYGGLLWCLGLFDRPFDLEQPIFGKVRPRSTTQHARRLDVAAYALMTARPARPSPPRVAVIGAGIAGLACARTLMDHGYPVELFDKGRQAGGRIATRRFGILAFDHGAQYFTVRDPRFRRWGDSWAEDGLVAPWAPAIHDHQQPPTTTADVQRWVAVPSMSALARHLALDLSVATGRRVTALDRRPGGWCLHFDDGTEANGFDAVIVAVPAPQATELLRATASPIADVAASAVMSPCWALMLAYPAPLPVPFDATFLRDGPLGWCARNASKPGRAAAETWVLHATPEWSQANLEKAPQEVAVALHEAFAALGPEGTVQPTLSVTHRWRYALVEHPVGEACLFDAARLIGACGDWCLGGRIEAAFLSGVAAAGRLLGTPPAVGGTAASLEPGVAHP